jgi:monothiol glutaredoxin
MNKPKIVAYLKPHCGWSKGVRAILNKYELPFEDKDMFNNPEIRQEMIEKSGQTLSPCVEIDGVMLPDISGDEVEGYLLEKNYVTKSDAPVGVSTNSSCSDADHAAQRAAMSNIQFIKKD